MLTRGALQAAFAEGGVSRDFHVSKEVSILGVSLFVLGLGIGPLVAGPMSEIYGRSAVYHVSFIFFFIFMFPVAFAPNISKCVVHSNRAWCDNAVALLQRCIWFFDSFPGTLGRRFSA